EDGVVRVLPVEPVALAELFEMLFLADGHEVSSRVGAGCRHTQPTRAPKVKSTSQVGFGMRRASRAALSRIRSAGYCRLDDPGERVRAAAVGRRRRPRGARRPGGLRDYCS